MSLDTWNIDRVIRFVKSHNGGDTNFLLEEFYNGCLFWLSADVHAAYFAHTASVFPELLNTLRAALVDIIEINKHMKEMNRHPYTLLQSSIEQAITSAENIDLNWKQ